jgi:hypothetical protein
MSDYVIYVGYVVGCSYAAVRDFAALPGSTG